MNSPQPPHILFQMHIMWYESHMINETLDSLYAALKNSPIPVKIILGLNSQTYIEKPKNGSASEMFSLFLNHPVLGLANTSCEYITDDSPFYNIGDWRREVYNPNSIYTVWGESDCLIPSDFFEILTSAGDQINHPHFITLASRKMWDATWDHVEHPDIQKYPRGDNREDLSILYAEVPSHLASEMQISQDQLDHFNNSSPATIKQISPHKVDGALLSISRNFPTPFIGNKVHFAREDSCFEVFCRIKGIPQFLISTRIKGHNYKHPQKRMNTIDSREDDAYKKYEQESVDQINLFLKSLSETTTRQDLATKGNKANKNLNTL